MFAGGNPGVKRMTDRAREITGRYGHIGRMRGGPSSPKPIAIDVGAKKPIAEPAMKHFKWREERKQPKGQDYSRRFYGKTHDESFIGRRDEEIIQEGIKELLGKLVGAFKSPELERAFEESPLTQKMRQDAIDMTEEYISGVVEMTKEHIESLKSTETLDKATGGKFSALIQKKGKEETKKVAQLVVGSTKKGIKDIAIQNITEKMNGMPDGLKKIYQAGIKQIESL